MSYRSVYSSVLNILELACVNKIAVIAEGVPDQLNIDLVLKCREKNVM